MLSQKSKLKSKPFRSLKNALLLCFLIGVVAVKITFAQRFNSGLMLGLAATQVDGDAMSGYNRAGLIAGGFVNYKIYEQWGLQMELKYIGKGSRRIPRPDLGDYRKLSINLSYLEFPISARYYYKEKFVFDAGLYPAYLLNSSIRDEIGDLEIRNPFYSMDFGFLMGMYYHFSKSLSMNVRYSYSILPIREHIDGARRLIFRGDFNNVMAFTLYYQFQHAAL